VSQLTPSQQAAISAHGNVLLEAGAGSGKTSTLVARCLSQITDPGSAISLDEILMVTFTEAAAAEMRHRIRKALNEKFAAAPSDARLAEQIALLDNAHIGTLHGFCFRLIREHFQELGLDPQTRVLDESEARLLANDTIRELLDAHYEKQDEPSARVRDFIRLYGNGKDDSIAALVVSTHRFLETLPDPEKWLSAESTRWEQFDRAAREAELVTAVSAQRDEWLELLEAQDKENVVAANCARLLAPLSKSSSRTEFAAALRSIIELDNEDSWPRGTKGKFRDPILPVFTAAEFYAALAEIKKEDSDPLEEDFKLAQPHVLALLGLVAEFSKEFAQRKRRQAGMDFSDLEQFSLRLLWDRETNRPTVAAQEWREKLSQIYVDEYQDINEAQDRIIAALSRDGSGANRFLVGDVKQSIYGFRLARPDIFLRYAKDWRTDPHHGRVLPLSDNFRSHESILEFVNRTFAALMIEPVGSIRYDETAFLRFGDPAGRALLSRTHDSSPRVELIHRLTSSKKSGEAEDSAVDEDSSNAEKEAQIAARRLSEMVRSDHQVFDRTLKALRPVEWRDMAILLRATSGKAEIYTRVFARAGIPLLASRRGFFDAIEISDMVSLLTLLDNPLQDIPLLAVLRSPVVGLDPDQLVAIRVAAHGEPYFWTALLRFHELNGVESEHESANRVTAGKLGEFLKRFERWRALARRGSLSQCLEEILESTQYLPWLSSQPNGAEAQENIQRLLELAQQYDSWQGRGLHRFLEYVRLVQDEGSGPEPAAATHENAVRLMTVHASKGLEFPVVVLADLGKRFRDDQPTAGIHVEESLGVCPMITLPDGSRSYPSFEIRQAESLGTERALAEELRLLYVAMTRACDRLILLGTTPKTRPENYWNFKTTPQLTRQQLFGVRSLFDFLGPLLPEFCGTPDWFETESGASELLSWRTIQPDETVALEPPAEPVGNHATPKTFQVDLPKLRKRIEFQYPFLDAIQKNGKTTVTRLRKQFESPADNESATLFGDTGSTALSRTRSFPTGKPGKLSAAAAGIAYHTFFQKTRLDQAGTEAGLASELRRLENEGHLSADESAVIDTAKASDFWNGDVGRKFLEDREQVRRELPFTVAFKQTELEAFAGKPSADRPGADDLIIVQGIADLVLIRENEIWILDFKSDRVSPDELNERIARYRPQVQLYQQALERTCRRPVTRLWLHFLHLGRSVEINLAKATR